MLIAAFRATLEDVIEADVLLHVRDVAHVETEAQSADVGHILADLGIDPSDESRIIEVWNKSDLLPGDERERLLNAAGRSERRPVLVSALTGEGMDHLLAGIEARIAQGRPTFEVWVDPSDGQGLNWLYEQAEVLERTADEQGNPMLRVRIAPEKEPRLLKRFAAARRV
jgi:GTP-binding protein HflX